MPLRPRYISTRHWAIRPGPRASSRSLFSTSSAQRKQKDDGPSSGSTDVGAKDDTKTSPKEQTELEEKGATEAKSSSSEAPPGAGQGTPEPPDGRGSGAAGSSPGSGDGSGDGGKKGRRSGGDRALQKPIVPEIYPQVMAIPIAKRPLFPGFYKAITIKDQNVANAITEMIKRGQPYVGAFLFKMRMQTRM